MLFPSQKYSAARIASLLSLLCVMSYGQALKNDNIFADVLQSQQITNTLEHSPIFSENRSVQPKNYLPQQTKDRQMVQYEKSKELPITVEPIVPVTSELRSKGDNYRHVAKQVDFLAVYMRKRVGGESKVGDSRVAQSFGLRWVEPTYELKMRGIAGSQFTGELESRPGKPLEVKVTKPLAGGEMGAFLTIDRHGTSNAYVGLRGDLSLRFWRNLSSIYRKY